MQANPKDSRPRRAYTTRGFRQSLGRSSESTVPDGRRPYREPGWLGSAPSLSHNSGLIFATPMRLSRDENLCVKAASLTRGWSFILNVPGADPVAIGPSGQRELKQKFDVSNVRTHAARCPFCPMPKKPATQASLLWCKPKEMHIRCTYGLRMRDIGCG